jgi:hypothetical protein
MLNFIDYARGLPTTPQAALHIRCEGFSILGCDEEISKIYDQNHLLGLALALNVLFYGYEPSAP